MASGTCTPNQYTSKSGKCCNRCDAGTYVKADCEGTKVTECVECGRGHFLATRNHLTRCQDCTVCDGNSKMKVMKECTAKEDTVCTCVEGFYCSNDKCEHCQQVRSCPPGEGVQALALHTNDTICGVCEEGTYSNVTDFRSPCRAHTRCEDLGRDLSSPGTPTSDAVCGSFTRRCHWLLPAGLWSGLLVSAAILLALCWCLKRKSRQTVWSPMVAVTQVDVIPAEPQRLLAAELKDYSPKTCAVDGCDLPVYTPGHDMVPGSTPLKVSFTDSSHENGSTGYSTGNFCRSFSEPQEDEWCGT